MYILKCKMCGGDMEIAQDKTFGTCEYCGSTMTLPKVDDDQRAAAFNRGNHFRRIGEFDKALSVYERIVNENDNDAEAHWCCALCRFGIEYVEDPNTYEFIPTCHRASFDSFLEDVDYLAAVENSEGITRRQYQKEAVKIAEIQRAILATSQNEEPFDVFICYKETDDNTKQRTHDSIDAQEIYYQLTQEGYRVFFARITLEDKIGSEYEPYIFAALNSAKVMIVVGSKPEYFSTVWVKNEWSRFLALMRKERSKLLIPCYRDMDPYDLPEQLSVLQSYDLTKIGFMQDLLRGIDKIFRRDKTPQTAFTNMSGNSNTFNTDNIEMSTINSKNISLLKRGHMALDDNEFDRATTFFEMVLNNDPECAQAYWGKVLSEKKVSNTDALIKYILDRIHQEKATESESLNRKSLIEIAREADEQFGLLGKVSDSELAVLLEDLKKPETCENGFLYYKKLSESIDENAISDMLDDRNYNRALQYADDQIRTEKDYIIHFLKNELNKAAEKEQETVSIKKQEAQDDNLAISREIKKRLQNILEEKQIKERGIVSQRKENGKTAIEEEKEYRDKLNEWQKKRKEYELNLYNANAQRAEYQREIYRMKQEREKLAGIKMAKKKEIDDYIMLLEKKKNEIRLPDDPGEKPENLSDAQFGQEVYQQENDLTDEDLFYIVCCGLSPYFRENYETFTQAKAKIQEGSELLSQYKSDDALKAFIDANKLLDLLPAGYIGRDSLKTKCKDEIQQLNNDYVFITIEEDGMTTCPRCGKRQKGDRSICRKCCIKFVLKGDEKENTIMSEGSIESDNCPKCGNIINRGMKFCSKCGTLLRYNN